MEEMAPYEAGNGRNKKFIAIAVVILLIICGIGGYLYYKRTPAYSMQLIQESVKEHNWKNSAVMWIPKIWLMLPLTISLR